MFLAAIIFLLYLTIGVFSIPIIGSQFGPAADGYILALIIPIFWPILYLLWLIKEYG